MIKIIINILVDELIYQKVALELDGMNDVRIVKLKGNYKMNKPTYDTILISTDFCYSINVPRELRKLINNDITPIYVTSNEIEIKLNQTYFNKEEILERIIIIKEALSTISNNTRSWVNGKEIVSKVFNTSKLIYSYSYDEVDIQMFIINNEYHYMLTSENNADIIFEVYSNATIRQNEMDIIIESFPRYNATLESLYSIISLYKPFIDVEFICDDLIKLSFGKYISDIFIKIIKVDNIKVYSDKVRSILEDTFSILTSKYDNFYKTRYVIKEDEVSIKTRENELVFKSNFNIWKVKDILIKGTELIKEVNNQ